MLIQPPQKKSKIGSKEHENRQKNLYGTLLKLCAVILVYIALLTRLERLFFKGNACFSMHSIQRSHHATTTAYLPPQIDALLSQPFVYLARGLHCYAFLSHDKRAVLKFHRIPSPARKGSFAKNEKKMKRYAYFIDNYITCTANLPEETGCLWLHTDVSPPFKKKVLLIDKAGNRHTVNLNETTFILQSAAQRVYTVLQSCEIEQAKTIITQIVELLRSSYLKGYIHTDPVMEKNFGLLSNRAIFIDFGDVIKGDIYQNLSAYLKEATFDLHCWLKSNRALLLEHFDTEIKRLSI